MSLTILVGSYLEASPAVASSIEGETFEAEAFVCLERLLQSAGFDYREPKQRWGTFPWQYSMRYAAIHYLRRIAAHLWESGTLPEPGLEKPTDDPVVKRYYAFLHRQRSHISRSMKPYALEINLSFEHLVDHNDDSGYYVPVALERVIIGRCEGALQYIGSSYSLLRECETLARALEMPDDCDPKVIQAGSLEAEQGVGDARWKRYGVESFVCSVLLYAARLSVARHSSIVFC